MSTYLGVRKIEVSVYLQMTYVFLEVIVMNKVQCN